MAMLAGGVAWSRKFHGKGLTVGTYEAMGMCCSNSGYVGYPMMLLIFGPLGGVILALNLIVENILVIPVLMALADAGAHDGVRPSLLKTLGQTAARLVRNPLIIAIVLGFAVALLGWQLPSFLTRTVTLFSAASGGLALFIIGGNLVGLSVKGMRRQVSTIAFGKLVLHPLSVWGAAMLIPLIGLPALQGDLLTAAVLSAAMPMMGIYTLLASRHGHEGFTAAALLVTTGASFFTLSAILWLMRHMAGWLA